MKIIAPKEVAKKITEYCISTNKKFILISGNGASGKSELGKLIAEEAKTGKVNLVEMDDFLVETSLRHAAVAKWKDKNGDEQVGRYTACLRESYFLQNVLAIMNNLKKGNDYYHWPKRAKKAADSRILYASAVLTVIEGIGTAFLEKNDELLSIFITCEKDVEVRRRTKRKQTRYEETAKSVLEHFSVRNSQYKTFVKPHKEEHQLILESKEDFTMAVVKDANYILRNKFFGTKPKIATSFIKQITLGIDMRFTVDDDSELTEVLEDDEAYLAYKKTIMSSSAWQNHKKKHKDAQIVNFQEQSTEKIESPVVEYTHGKVHPLTASCSCGAEFELNDKEQVYIKGSSTVKGYSQNRSYTATAFSYSNQ